MKINLATGQLQLNSPQPQLLQQLTGFGSRANKKRGFIFISKVLGKYSPCPPDTIAWAQQQLAAALRPQIQVDKPTVVIGFAETATGLGFGVYERLGLNNSLYIHTTRYQLAQDLLVAFQEEHSHAPAHYLYQPRDPTLRARLAQAEQVVLIDDEFSTGKTLQNIVAQLQQHLPNAQAFIAGALLSWIPAPLEGIDTVALHQGRYEFSPNHADIAALGRASNPEAKALDAYIPYNFGRFGLEQLKLDMSVYVDADAYIGKRVLVLGTGEFIYPAFKLAAYLQQQGANTWVQSTGRSPINIDAAIQSRLRFWDNYHEAVDNFLYNIEPYDVIMICYETPSLPENHQLKTLLHAYAPEVIEIMMEHA